MQHARSHRKLCRAHNLKANKREVHLIKIKYCEDTRPGHQLEASGKQHETLCQCLIAKEVSLHSGVHTILLGVGGSIYTSDTLNQFEELGLDLQRIHKTAASHPPDPH